MGKLVVKIICGRNLKGSDTFSDADGYIKLTLGSKTFRTKAIDNDANPNWNESFSFFVSEAACDHLKIELWDANTFKDDFLAVATVPLDDLVKDTRILKRVSFSGGKGEVHIELLADFGAPAGSAPPQNLGGSFSNLGGSYSSLGGSYSSVPPQQQQVSPNQPQMAPQPPPGWGNPYAGAGGSNPYSNPYAQPGQSQPQPQGPPPTYNYPGQNPYAGQNYYQQSPPPQQQQMRSPPPQPQAQPGGGYPSAASYGGAGYQNPYAHTAGGAPHQQQQQSGFVNPYASQYPGAAPSQYSYPGQQQQQQQRPPGGAPQPGGLGYLPGNVGGVSYY